MNSENTYKCTEKGCKEKFRIKALLDLHMNQEHRIKKFKKYKHDGDMEI